MSVRSGVIVVTGGNGFLGKHVCRVMVRAGYDNTHAIGHGQFDLTQEQSVQEMFQTFAPSVIVHLAARVGGIGRNQKEPAEMLSENLLMGIYLIRTAAERGVEKFIQVGTGCSYPEKAVVPTQETSLWQGFPVPVTAPYGIAKLMLLPLLQSYCQQFEMAGAYLIPANLYGPGDHYEEDRSHVIPALIKKFVDGVRNNAETVSVWGSPQVTRDFLYVEDCAKAVCDAVGVELPVTPINLSSGVETRMGDLVESIQTLTGFHGRVVWDSSKPEGYPRRCMDNSVAKTLLGFAPRIPLGVGLRAAIEDYMS